MTKIDAHQLLNFFLKLGKQNFNLKKKSSKLIVQTSQFFKNKMDNCPH